MSKNKPRKVYFIKPVGMEGPIKIGCSQSPDNRRVSLSSWSPFALEIIAELDGDFDLERRFHAQFRHLHERREWFRAGDDLLVVIESINAGAFDIDTLPPPEHIATCTNGKPRPRSDLLRRRMSYSTRAWQTQKRTGFKCPVDASRAVQLNDEAAMALAERYFERPHFYGISPIALVAGFRRRSPEWDWSVRMAEAIRQTKAACK